MNAVRGKSILVAGAASGIGAAAARLLGERGAHVLCADADAAGASACADRIARAGGRAEDCALDVTSQEAIVAGIERATASFGGLDGFVYSVGTTTTADILTLDRTEWDRVINVNLTGAFASGQCAAKAMATAGRGGAIVMVTSQLAHVAVREKTAYLASKGGMAALVRGMALDLAPHRIRVNAIAPGPVLTGLTKARFADSATLSWTLDQIPLGRLGTPEEIAAAIAFLAGDDSTWITGTTLVVDGGYLAH